MHHTTFIPFYQLEWSKNIEKSGQSRRKLRHVKPVKPHNIPQRNVGEIGEIPMILQLWCLKSPCYPIGIHDPHHAAGIPINHRGK